MQRRSGFDGGDGLYGVDVRDSYSDTNVNMNMKRESGVIHGQRERETKIENDVARTSKSSGFVRLQSTYEVPAYISW